MTEPQAVTAPVRQDRQAPSVERLAEVVFWCFLVSGGMSLILEGTLTRLLRFVLGNTTLAITTVLCAFMAGLALGSYVAGRLADRTPRLLRMYGLMEGAVGVACLLLPYAIAALEPAYRWMYLHLQDHPLSLSLARFLLCGLLLLVPSTFMGATLPVLTRWASLRQGQLGRSVARMYAINSAGAAAGALVCGFLLLPGLGVTWTLRLACGVDIAICILMLVLDRRGEMVGTAHPTLLPVAPGPCSFADPAQTHAMAARWRTGLLVAYGLSGAAALVYEVAWTRGLALVIGSTTYAFSLMLAAFILGLAIGSAIMARLVDRLRGPAWWFGVVELAIGLSAMAALPLFGQMPIWVVDIVRGHHASFAALQAIEFGLVLLVMMLPTTLMGAAFPLVSRACASGPERVGHAVGGVYAANTAGAIAGAFVASFVLIPQLGTQNAILVAVIANVMIGAVILSMLASRGWAWRGLGAMAGAAFGSLALAWFPPWDPAVMSSGAYLYAENIGRGIDGSAAIRARMQAGTMVFHDEDMCTSVTVRDYPTGARVLSVGGKADASTLDDVPTQLLLAHGPLLLHPNPRSALVIGLASGMTLGAAACHDLQRIDCAEISPAVVEASRLFDEFNGHVLSDPRVRLIIGDGRNHLALTDTAYDVIISEPSNPWIAGVADLFTREFFEICRQRLAPGGLACVWLHAYQMEEPSFRGVVRSFGEAFGHVMVIEAVPWADYLLIGSDSPIRVPYGSLASRMGSPRLAGDLKRVGIASPADFLRRILTTGGLADYAAGAVAHTDDNALLEFAAPRAMYNSDSGVWIAGAMNRYRKVDLSFLGQDPADQPALAELRRTLDPLVQAQKIGMEAAVRHYFGDLDRAYAMAGQAAGLDPAGPEVLNSVGTSILERAEAARHQGDAGRALQYMQQASRLAPRLFAAQDMLGGQLARMGRWSEAAQAFSQAAALAPDDPAAADNLVWLLATCPDGQVRNGPEAVRAGEKACQAAGYKDPYLLRSLAAAYAEAGRFDDAVRTAGGGIEIATGAADQDLVARLQTEQAFYRQGRPYHEGPAPESRGPVRQ